MIFKPMRRMEKARRIILHHSESDFGSAKVFHDWHRAKGWAGIGYHYVIGNGDGADDGEKQIGRLTFYQGAHCKGNNSDSIGVVLVGSFTNHYPTDAQMESLIQLLTTECFIHKIDPNGKYALAEGLNISGHRDWGSTSCPGDKFYPLIAEVRKQVGLAL